ncbi:MAG TPA: SAM-dependent methyltransferase [Devosiaceae bacterium]|nr:SAM-dependent methyltransferase [Devosiaceae bacterium]
MPDPAPDLSELIDMQIRQTGPMSIATYMGLALTHPRKGYYKQGTAIGAAGDFITAPEVSQMFGELIGFFMVNLWQQMSEPKAFTVLELGPGRGTLMADMMRVAARAPGFAEAANIELFETDPELLAQQRTRLEPFHPSWIQSFDLAADTPLLVVANEFFDALPIRQFVRGKDGWHERMVGLGADGKRMFGLSPTPIPNESLPESVREEPEGAVFEAGLAAGQVMQRLASAVARRGGAILAIDYGYTPTQTGETLQAVRRHAYADPLEAPGESDLSAHVDFDALGQVARTAGLAVQPLAAQGDFLKHLGIIARAAGLAKANPSLAEEINGALDRLTSPSQMGTLFKVLCAASPGLIPQGFS